MPNETRKLFARILRAVAMELDPPVEVGKAETRSGGTGRPPPSPPPPPPPGP